MFNMEPPSDPIPLKRNLSAAEAIIDLEQLEHLQGQAERMKGLGNKHMANQEYTKAYNAYSAALELSPVGPNSHVFLSNRAAALLSLKKYTQAASDAQRAIGLSPEFSKAHARLGQALYFLKDYAGAVNAYMAATKFDPDNRITRQYLEKAQRKLVKQQRIENNIVQVHLNQNRQQIDINSQQNKKESFAEERKDSYSIDEDSAITSPTLGVQREVFCKEFQDDQNQHESNQVTPSKLAPNPHDSQSFSPNRKQTTYEEDDDDEEDPDVIEARKLYEKGNQLLQMKEYRYAIDEFSAALFLCPDHPHLSFQLCVGRANAHNHSRRHEAAANDARMAIGIRPDLPHGYSLLGRSLFYLKDYAGTVIALEESMRLMQPHEEPNVFDKAYLTKAQDALAASHSDDQTAHTTGTSFTSMTLRSTYTASTTKSSKTVPKLKPPRFVPREESVQNSNLSILPPMPSQWPAQSKAQQNPFRVGNERKVTFGEGPLGIKLNRGCDGFVRVLSTYMPVSSKHKNAPRSGQVLPGDIVREAAGVDLRRPLTNIMWGDTVALVRMSPRPLILLVAKELSTPPPQVLEELGKAAAEEMQLMLMDGVKFEDNTGGNNDLLRRIVVPSPAIGEEAVSTFATETNIKLDVSAESKESKDEPRNEQSSHNEKVSNLNVEETETPIEKTEEKADVDKAPSSKEENLIPATSLLDDASDEHSDKGEKEKDLEDDYEVISNTVTFDETPPLSLSVQTVQLPALSDISDVKPYVRGSKIAPSKSKRKPPRRQRSFDIHVLGANILFNIEKINTTLPIIPWSATESTRKLIHHSHILKLQKTRFWGEKYVPRMLVLYRNPSLILILRRPENIQEVKRLLDLPRNTKMKRKNEDGTSILNLYYVAESVIDLNFCKLRLSPLTTETSTYISEGFVPLQKLQQDPRRGTCFEIITPTETYSISLDSIEEPAEDFQNLAVETSCWETSITYELHNAYKSDSESEEKKSDQGWKHQIVLGTIHSHVLLGDIKSLAMALSSITFNGVDAVNGGSTNGTKEERNRNTTSPKTKRTQHSDINVLDDDGWTALHYACSRRASNAVNLLINAGADCTIQTPNDQKTPCHMAADRLDEKSLSYILGAKSDLARPDPNALDGEGYTPMHLAVAHGRNVGNTRDPIALKKCLAALAAWGGHIISPLSEVKLLNINLHPVALVASQCCPEELDAVLSHCQYFFPLLRENSGEEVSSLELKFDFPIHMALISLRKHVLMLTDNSDRKHFNAYEFALYKEPNKNVTAIARTIQVLLRYGFEPNQRCVMVDKQCQKAKELNALYGFSPLHILALTARESVDLREKILKECDDDSTGYIADESNRIVKQVENILDCLIQVTKILVQNGARINLPEPPSYVENNKEENGKNAQGMQPEEKNIESNDTIEGWLPTFVGFDKSSLRIDDDKVLLKSMGGMQNLNSYKTKWSMVSTIIGCGRIKLYQKSDLKKSSESPNAKNKESSCFICWKPFGRVINRKHTCRVTGKIVCDECSSKRVLERGEEFRITDGQFLFAKCESVIEKNRVKEAELAKRKERKERITTLQAQRYNCQNSNQAEAKETTQRNELFGLNIGKGLMNLITGENEDEDRLQSSTNQVNHIASSLNQTRDALNERGEKLHNLSDKTAALADQSREFAELAKQLRQDQQKGFFSMFN